MDMVGRDLQAQGPGDGLLDIWASGSAPAPRDAAGEEVASPGG